MPSPNDERGQMLLAEEYFAAGDDRFLSVFRAVHQPKPLAALADRWKKDPRPWARQQLFQYLAEPMNVAGHQPVVKHLFKHAEAAGDHELMGRFMLAFDRHVRRRIRKRHLWDRTTRTVNEVESLVVTWDALPLIQDGKPANPLIRMMTMGRPVRQKPGKLFKYRTRYYLRRRAWRYFRYLGVKSPESYLQSIARVLEDYEDADLQRGENILDSWGLMHACFGEHAALDFLATHIQVKDGHSFSELSAAPYLSSQWQSPMAAPILLSLSWHAHSQLVRLWTRQLFERWHPHFLVTVADLLHLLEHDDPEVQLFGARLLKSSSSLSTMSLSSWFQLFQTTHQEAVALICEAFLRNVSPDRLKLSDCLALARSQPVPVAQLGWQLLKTRGIQTPQDAQSLLVLAEAKCAAIAGEMVPWVLDNLGRHGLDSSEYVIRFFDGAHEEMRSAAWKWLLTNDKALQDPTLWSRLVETPYDDIRLPMIDFLHQQTTAAVAPSGLTWVWRSVLLGVHRGGRQKTKAIQQIAQAIIANPSQAETLLPVMVATVRSLRGPETRAGLAAVIRVVTVHPQLASQLQSCLPELKIMGEAV